MCLRTLSNVQIALLGKNKRQNERKKNTVSYRFKSAKLETEKRRNVYEY